MSLFCFKRKSEFSKVGIDQLKALQIAIVCFFFKEPRIFSSLIISFSRLALCSCGGHYLLFVFFLGGKMFLFLDFVTKYPEIIIKKDRLV